MQRTLLDYLTVSNPHLIGGGFGGPTTRTRKIYGPDKEGPWGDMTFENLQMAFGDVLSEETNLPKQKKKISSEKRKLCAEKSFTKVAVAWNEPVVQKALKATHKVLGKDRYGGAPSVEGLQFTENDGRGNVGSDLTGWHVPDWLVYNKYEGAVKMFDHQGNPKEIVRNLIPGDCKPSKKWKSEWLNCSDGSNRTEAEWVLRQVTKYMQLAKTRYSFILSDEELVPVRLSTYDRSSVADMEKLQKAGRENIAGPDYSFEPGLSDVSGVSIDRDPDGSFADGSPETGTVLEWCSIPWDNKGVKNLTINLAFWWLCVLAMQDTSIKTYGSYTLLGEKTREGSPKPPDNDRRIQVTSEVTSEGSEENEEAEEVAEVVARTKGKRRAEEPEEIETRTKKPRTRWSSLAHTRTTTTQPSTSTAVSSTNPRRSARLATTTRRYTGSETSSEAGSETTIGQNDETAMSFSLTE
ncbi:hypothetical protein GGR51DRAFT_298340 [Nemania sp. FL0031]|nr:hypothetical protein GGR51DRAFT_298340 [Nemania sp. FL0031]